MTLPAGSDASGSQSRGRAARASAPVTGVERLLDPRRPIVTRTDRKGRIVYANPAFLEISGFEREELIGKPHNVVRHPDMPREAFEDLWTTVRSGRPWQGLVCNRAKNGDHYWVDAYVSPVTRNGEPIGYMSVRSAPSDAAKRAAERLYRDVRAGRCPYPTTRRPRFVPCWATSAGVIAAVLATGAAAFATGPSVAGWVLMALSAACAIGGWVALRASLRRATEALDRALVAMGEGDFGSPIEVAGPAEFAGVLTRARTLQVNLRAQTADVRSGGAGVGAEVERVRTATAALRESATEQTDGIIAVAVALEHLSRSVQEITAATARATEHAEAAEATARAGSHDMAVSTDANREAGAVLDDAKGHVEALGEAVGRIGLVVETINAIAEQTNFLALNAAIEAARAGEQGRGFTVVAEEVRKLAERTRQSTQSIVSTIEGIRSRTEEAFAGMRRAVEGSHRGVARIEAANASLAGIVEASRGVARSAQQITAMLRHQSETAQDVAARMEAMSALTERNAARLADVDAAMTQLGDTARALHATLSDEERVAQGSADGRMRGPTRVDGQPPSSRPSPAKAGARSMASVRSGGSGLLIR